MHPKTLHARLRVVCGGVLLALLCLAAPARAHIEIPLSLGKVINDSSNIVVMTVTKVDKAQGIIIYQKVRDLKGKHPQEVIKHAIKGELVPGEIKAVMEWAEPGKTALLFYSGGASETCTGMNWYQAYAQGEWWGMSHGEGGLLRSFAGKPEKLAAAVTEIMAGKEVLVPCFVNGDRKEWVNRRGKVMRSRASLKLLDYNDKRDFAGWGGEDIRRLEGMPGFSHFAALGRSDAEAQAVTAVDFDGDGKPDICLASSSRVLLLANQGDSFGETGLPGLTGGCRSAVWADYNADGKPDLLLATPTGPKLFANLGSGLFRDDTALLPKDACYNLTAAAWIDADCDGKPDVLLANGFHGLQLYRNNLTAEAKPGPRFDDVSTSWGLGAASADAFGKGDSLAVADVNGDGRTDVLYGSGNGTLLLNSGKRFELKTDRGIAFKPGKIGPVFVDFDQDGHPDLFAPQNGNCKLYRNDGAGRFVDVTPQAGDLSKPIPNAVAAAWGDFNNDGKLDVFVGCLRGPNRYFENAGNGGFTEKTDELGLVQKIFNSQAVALTDLNGDGRLDLILNNEGQDAAVLFGNPAREAAKRSPLVVQLPGGPSWAGGKVRVLDGAGKPVQQSLVSGGEARGGQSGWMPRFALEPGAYQIELTDSAGQKRTKDVRVQDAPMRVRWDEAPAALPKK